MMMKKLRRSLLSHRFDYTRLQCFSLGRRRESNDRNLPTRGLRQIRSKLLCLFLISSLDVGPTELQAWIVDGNGDDICGADDADAERLQPPRILSR